MEQADACSPDGSEFSAELGQVPEGAEPRAWAIFLDDGNARMWGTLQPHVQKLADAEGLEITPLYDKQTVDRLRAALQELEAACNERAARLTPEAYLLAEMAPGMPEAMQRLDAARQAACKLLGPN